MFVYTYIHVFTITHSLEIKMKINKIKTDPTHNGKSKIRNRK